MVLVVGFGFSFIVPSGSSTKQLFARNVIYVATSKCSGTKAITVMLQ
jgi:hypothetical protein